MSKAKAIELSNDICDTLGRWIESDVQECVDDNPERELPAQQFVLQCWLGAMVGRCVTTAAAIQGDNDMRTMAACGEELSAVLHKYYPALPNAEVHINKTGEQN